MANIVTKTYDLNVTPGGCRTLVNLSQYENGRLIVFRLVGDASISIPSGATAVIEGTKPDGNVYSGSGTVDASARTVSFQEEVQMTAVAGQYMAKVKIMSGSQMVASGIITVLVSADPVPDGAVESDSEIQGLIAEARQTLEGVQNDVNVLEARMDEFASLPPGSTEGNAELLDIRVGANGETYPTAGDAVRNQVTDLKTALDDSLAVKQYYLYGHPSLYAGNLNNNTGEESVRTDNKVFISAFVDSSVIQYLKFNTGYAGSVLYYKSDQTFINSVTWSDGQGKALNLPANTAYVRLRVFHSGFPVITATEAMLATNLYKLNPLYTMNEEIGEIETTANEYYTKVNSLTDYTWQNGQLMNGVDTGNTDRERITCLEFFCVPKGTHIRLLTSDVWMYVFWYSAPTESAYVSSSGQWVQEWSAESDLYVRFNIRKDNNAAINAPFDDIVRNVIIDRITNDNAERLFVPDELPSYWQTYMSAKIPTLQSVSEENALNGDTFVFFTDYHIENNAGYSHKLIKQIIDNTAIKMVVFGGDAYNGSSTKSATLEKMRKFYKRFKPLGMIGLRGNHEYNWNDGGSVAEEMTDSDQYSFLLKDHENEYSVKTVPGQLYYTVDNHAQKIRYIMCDARYETDAQSIAQDTEQQTWITNKILELQDGWGVVVMSHQALSPNSDPSVQLQLDNKGWAILRAIRAATGDSNNHAYIIALICGHVHRDSERTYDGFPVICTTCDAMQDQTATRTLGTVTEQAFDVFTIDKTNKKVIITRIGSGSDREYSYA